MKAAAAVTTTYHHCNHTTMKVNQRLCLFILVTSSCWSTQRTMVVSGLAAAGRNKKKGGAGNKKNVVASSVKGFGVKPPTFEEVVGTFPTRMGSNALEEPCPCGTSGTATYAECCAPFHNGVKVPQQPLEVLKTRYTAFVFRNIPYIIATTHPVCRDFSPNKIKWAKELNKNGMFDSFDFVSLQPIVDATTATDQQQAETSTFTNHEAFLEFKVTLRAKADGATTVVSEKSRFLQADSDNNQPQGWLYAGGDVRSEVVGLQDTILNQ